MSLASSRLRSSLLGSVAVTVLVVLQAPSAMAQVPGIAPSIEVHTDVIESLRQEAMHARQPVAAAPVAVAPPVQQAPVVQPQPRQPVNMPSVTAPHVPAPAPYQETAPTRWGMPASVPMNAPPGQEEVRQPIARPVQTPSIVQPSRNVAPVIPAEPVVVKTPQERAAEQWTRGFAVPAGKPVPPALPAPAMSVPEPVDAPAPVLPPEPLAPKPAAPKPIAPKPVAPEPIAPLPLPLPERVAPAPVELPPLPEVGAPKAPLKPVPLPAPIELPPLHEVDAPKAPLKPVPLPAPVALPPLPGKAAPAPIELPPLTPQKPLPEIMAPELPPVQELPAEAPEPESEMPAPAEETSSAALQAPPPPPGAVVAGGSYGLMDDIKRLMRKMLGKEPETLKPITTPIPVPVLPDMKPSPKASLKARVPEQDAPLAMPDIINDEPEDAEIVLPRPKAVAPKLPEKLIPLPPVKPVAPAEKKPAKEVKAPPAKPEKVVVEPKVVAKEGDETEGLAPLVLPPLPGEKKDSAPAMPAELEPLPELAPLPPLPAAEKKAPVGLPSLPDLPAAEKDAPAKKADALAGLPPISMLEEDNSRAAKAAPFTAVTSLPNAKDLPPLPSLTAKPEPVKAEAKPVEKKAAKTESRTVKATPVTEVGGADLPPIMALPPLPSEAASVLAPIEGPAPKASDALELLEKNGSKLPPKAAELASLPADLPPLPTLPEDMPAAPKAVEKLQEKAAGAAVASASAGAVQVVFKKDAMDIPAGSESNLQSFAKTVVAAPGKRVVIASFASGKGDEQARAARKIALSRGLKVRSYLIDQGVDALRINVSSKMDDGNTNPDRVDISLQ